MAKGKAYYAVSGLKYRMIIIAGIWCGWSIAPSYNIHVGILKQVNRKRCGDQYQWRSGICEWQQNFFLYSKNLVRFCRKRSKRHLLGTPESQDATVYEEKDKSNYIGVEKSKNGKYISSSRRQHFLQTQDLSMPIHPQHLSKYLNQEWTMFIRGDTMGW